MSFLVWVLKSSWRWPAAFLDTSSFLCRWGVGSWGPGAGGHPPPASCLGPRHPCQLLCAVCCRMALHLDTSLDSWTVSPAHSQLAAAPGVGWGGVGPFLK